MKRANWQQCHSSKPQIYYKSDSGLPDEILIFKDRTDNEFASVIPDNDWGAAENFPLSSGGMAIVEIEFTYNPPQTYLTLFIFLKD